MTKKISFFSLAILIIAAIDSIRNLPSAAIFGGSLVFFFVFAALIFLIPTALVSAELAAAFPDKGGVYAWIYKAFGEKMAMAAIWLQWINTMVWFPSFLFFVAGTFAYLVHPEVAENPTYFILFTTVLFWILTFVNLYGLSLSTKINNVCAIAGTIFPMLLIIGLGALWALDGNPLQIDFSGKNFIPSFKEVDNWTSLIAIMASFLGIELAGVHINDVKNPQQNFPKAIGTAVAFILFSMVLGSLAIAVVLPKGEISLVAGVMQFFYNLLDRFGLASFVPMLAFFIGMGSVGTMINWLISPAKGLLHAAEFGFLPKIFRKTNRFGVAHNLLIAQAILVSLISAVLIVLPSINAFYWFLMALSTELYMIMYIFMFLAAIKLYYRHTNRLPSFRIPGKKWGMWGTAILGCIGCLTTIAITFFPPPHIEVGNTLQYFLTIIAGNIIFLSPLFLFYRYKSKSF